MPRAREDQRQLYRCTSPFSIFRNGVPLVYAGEDEVLDNDPILKTHPHHFEPANERVLRRTRVEQATAAPNELRRVSTIDPDKENSDG